jgi:hypothetical protein
MVAGKNGLRSNVASEVVAMTKRLACPPAPGPLEDYATQFDPLFARLAQRRGFRAYLEGLLLPRDRNKTLTSLAGAEPIVAAQHKAVQGLQWFLSESSWDYERVSQRRVQLLVADPATAPHDQGVLVIDDSGDRKAGSKTAHVARQWLGSVGKTDNGIVAVTSLWADERVYWPIDVVPYTPASRLAKGKRDLGFRTKPQLAAELVGAAQKAGIGSRAVVADCFYGHNTGFVEALGRAGVAWVLAVKPRKVRPYSLRNWAEQGYKQIKHELGWSDFQVRSDRAICRHWQLVCCAFSFCWRAWFAKPPAQPAPAEPAAALTGAARGERTDPRRKPARAGLLAGDAAPGTRLADPLGRARALVAVVVERAPAGPAAAAA